MRYVWSYSEHEIFIFLVFAIVIEAITASAPPVIDLGYALHQATISPENPAYFQFPNIRYAAPPLGALRFSSPQPPLNNRSAGIQDGSYGKICPQANPLWNNATLANAPPGPTESEDCLFLDVTVSEATFKQASAPVLVWIHGGGYIMRNKAEGGSPIGILERSAEHTEGAVFVAIAYRLGAFGWLSGPTFQETGTANVGLYDQRTALDWVQKYIHLFGGDSSRVTVMGESAGAGSIMHHITAYGGAQGPGKLPFQQAVMQSASVHNPVQSKLLEEELFQTFLAAAGVDTLDEARQLPSETLQLANKEVIYGAPFGLYIFQPTVDGSYITNILGVSFLNGQFDPTISVISAHNSNEGFVFTDPAATNSSALETYMEIYFPAADPSIITYISNTLYPPIYDGSQPYTTPFDRLDLLISEMMIACNSRYISTAKGNDTYNYMFSVPPGHHRGDIPYTFWDTNGTTNDPVANVTTALDMQRYITAFVATGDPNAFQKETGLITFPKYGSDASVVNFNLTFVDVVVDPMKNPRYAAFSFIGHVLCLPPVLVRRKNVADVVDPRCDWWQRGLYL